MMYNIGNYGRYPVDIYSKVIRFILTWVLPFAFVGVYPASYFLGKEEWYFYTFATPIVGIVFFIVSVIYLESRGKEIPRSRKLIKKTLQRMLEGFLALCASGFSDKTGHILLK